MKLTDLEQHIFYIRFPLSRSSSIYNLGWMATTGGKFYNERFDLDINNINNNGRIEFKSIVIGYIDSLFLSLRQALKDNFRENYPRTLGTDIILYDLKTLFIMEKYVATGLTNEELMINFINSEGIHASLKESFSEYLK